MASTYSTRHIKADYAYSVEQISDLYGVAIHTVRRWITKEGLVRIAGMRPHAVHSSELRRFIEKRRQTRRKPCKANELFCMKCQHPREPLCGSATIKTLPNGTVKVQARCEVCKTKMNKAIKAAEWSEKHPLAHYLAAAQTRHNSAHVPPRECSLQMEMPLA